MPNPSETEPLLDRGPSPKATPNHEPTPFPSEPSLASSTIPFIVDFDPKGDPDNPLEWPSLYKWSIISLLALMAFTVTFTCLSVVPVASSIVRELEREAGQKASKSASVLLVTIWELGEAAGPLAIATLSELVGRYPVINGANLVFIVASLLASAAPNVPVLLGARFLTGLAVASNVLNPAIVGDVFPSEQRGASMSIIMFAPLLGGAVGPACSGWIAEVLGWRYVLVICAGVMAACEVVFLTFFRETYQVVILNRKAKRLREETGDQRYRTRFEGLSEGGGQTARARMWESLTRPVLVVCGSGVLSAMSLFGSVAYTFFYILSTTFPDILEERYDMSPSMIGLAFISFSIGSVLSVLLCNQTLDRIYISLRKSHQATGLPEYRLPLVIGGAFALPLIVLLYGWTADLIWPLWVMLLTVGLLGFCLMLGFLPVMAYVVDAFGLYSASALTAVIVTRCLMGTFLPLATEPLVGRFGYGIAFTILAALIMCLSPIPILVMRYGEKWRQRSRYSKEA